jgi:hypothetical protein
MHRNKSSAIFKAPKPTRLSHIPPHPPPPPDALDKAQFLRHYVFMILLPMRLLTLVVPKTLKTLCYLCANCIELHCTALNSWCIMPYSLLALYPWLLAAVFLVSVVTESFTNAMGQSPSREANSHSASQQITGFLWKPRSQEPTIGRCSESHESSPHLPTLFSKIHSNMMAVWKVRGLAAVRRCYAEGGSDSYAKL